MKIVADQDIPFVQHYFESAGDLILVSGRDLQSKHIKDADMLLVRSITKINEALLTGTNVKFVASPTTGTDHFDIAWLNKVGIRWANAHGCNAIAVEQYVICAIAALQQQGFLIGKGLKAAVIGVGTIGSRVVNSLKILGFDVLQCDPLRAQEDDNFPHVPLENLMDLDLISIHTPLTIIGEYPTFHMIQQSFLEKQKKNTILINTGRGAVIDFTALKLYGQSLVWCLDVWENEPFIDMDILQNATIATPHMAGYTIQSKYRGTQMMYRAAIQQNMITPQNIALLTFPKKQLLCNDSRMSWQDMALKVYNPTVTTFKMKQGLIDNDSVPTFDKLRKNASDRNEFAFVICENIHWQNELDQNIWHALSN